MKYAVLALCCIGWLAQAVFGQTIDLTPRYVSTTNDGIVIERPYFSNGKVKYAIALDRETKLSSGQHGAVFRFQKLVGAQFEIRYSSLKPEMAFDGHVAAYRTAALAQAAPGALGVSLESETADPLTINDWRSYRFVFTYTVNNELIKESITFLNLDSKQQVVLRTSASQKDFAEADGRAGRLMNSWYEMLPGDLKQSGS